MPITLPLVLLLAGATLRTHAAPVGLQGTVSVDYGPAFLKVNNQKELFVSTFYNEKWGFDQADAVFSYDIDSASFPGSFSSMQASPVAESVWPNEVEISSNVFQSPSGQKLQAVSVAGGFIVPNMKGELVVSVETEFGHVQFQVSPVMKGWFGEEKKSKWFYHRAEWVDMDGDGFLDLLTARSDFSVPPLLSYTGQLLWFKNPGVQQLTDEMMQRAKSNSQPEAGLTDVSDLMSPWEEVIIDDGAKKFSGDTMLRLVDLDGDGVMEIAATNFWDDAAGLLFFWDKDEPGIVVYSLKAGETSWGSAKYPETVERTTVAKDFGGPFDIEFHDINGDGKLDVLTSNHYEEFEKCLVLAFEIPEGAAWKTEPWTKRVIHQGFNNRVPKGMAPGAAQAFHPSKAHEEAGLKPWVVVAGDGTGYVHLYVAQSEDPNSWEYNEYLVYDSAEGRGENPEDAITIGAIALSEQSSGCTFMHVPVYEAGQIVVFNACEMENDLASLANQTATYLASPRGARAVSSPPPSSTTSSSSLPLLGGLLGGAAVFSAGAVAAVLKRRSNQAASAESQVAVGLDIEAQL